MSLRALPAPLIALALLATSAEARSQEPPPAEGAAPQASPKDAKEEERRKRLARLGSGKLRPIQTVGEVYPLESLIERCQEANPQVRARVFSEQFAELRQQEADWAIAPSFSLNAGATWVPPNADPNDVKDNVSKLIDGGPFLTDSVRMTIPLWTFGKLTSAQNLAGLGVDQAGLETRRLRLQLISQTREAYYSVQLGKHIQALIADGVDLIHEEIERLEEAREFGDESVDIKQLRKLQIYESDIQSQVLDNERLIRLTKSALSVLVQLKPEEFDVTQFNEEVDTSILLSLERYQALARENRPEIQLLNKGVAARREQVDLAFARFFPDLGLTVEWSQGLSTINSAQGPLVDIYPIDRDDEDRDGVVIPFDPYNFSRLTYLLGARLNLDSSTYWKYKQAEIQLSEAETQREAALQGLDLQIEKQWVEVNDHRRKIEILERRLRAAERWRKQIAIAYESGGAEFDDFLEPLRAYYEARLQLLKAQYDFQVGLSKLGEQVGATDIFALSRELSQTQPPEE